MASPARPVATSATRHDEAEASASTTTGAAAQPSVPPTVWTLKARAMRAGVMRRERMA